MGCEMEKFGALWFDKGTQESDPGVTTSNIKENADVKCIVNENLIIVSERLDMRSQRSQEWLQFCSGDTDFEGKD